MSADKFDEEMPNLTPRSIIWSGTEVSANSAAEAVAATASKERAKNIFFITVVINSNVKVSFFR